LAVEEVPPAADWKELVGSLVGDLRRGELEKVVLAREVRVHAPRPFEVARVLEWLRRDHPSCFVFAVARGERCFLGATPERLVRLQEGIVETTALAGSIARGATEEADRELGAALVASGKDQGEHAVVVRALRTALAAAGVALGEPVPPELMKLQNVQHLRTTLSGRLATDRTILDLLETLHPTPAVGGHPREAALSLIREREASERGWYAGPVGWMDARGEGEFAVAIRSALLDGAKASSFAGCGLVADSDPEKEYEESVLKLRPILSALGRSLP
jgi:isochorismate synthase